MGLNIIFLQKPLYSVNRLLDHYLHKENDGPEILLQKKIWIAVNLLGLPMLFLMSYIIGNKEGMVIVYINIFFGLAMIGSLISFYFHNDQIHNYALFTQLLIVVLTSVKVYLMGGILNGGGAVFVGLLGPFYALVLPDKKRAIVLFVFYLLLMTIATFAESPDEDTYRINYYFLGFSLSVIMSFSMLFYFTVRLEKLKREERQRMAEIDQIKTKFYTSIAHEFRTPLTLILGKSGQLKKKLKGYEDDFEMIERYGRNLLSLSQQMLDISKIEAKAMPIYFKQQDIVLYIKYVLESFHSILSSKDMTLNFYAEPNTLYMDFDEEKIRVIFSNLLSNAIKFSETGSSIDVVLKTVDRHDYKVVIEVIDRGLGISSENLSKIFDRYYQVEQNRIRNEEGSGLGLSLTKELVSLLGGEITVKSELNKGSKFSFWLPIRHKAEISQAFSTEANFEYRKNDTPYKSLITDKGKGNLTLLLVEDNKDVIVYLKSVLTHYNIVTANNGMRGFDLAIELIPDLVVSDVMMPLEDGFSLCKRLKEDLRTSHIPVILLTARADQSSRLEGINAGADAYLEKPFDPDELEMRISKLTELRLALQKRYSELFSGLLNKELENSAFVKEDHFMEKVLELIDLHMEDDEYGIKVLCKELGMSRSQLYRKFSALTNLTVHQFIRKRKLDRSRRLLRTTDLNVSEVAFDTGFKNLSHFSRVYNEEFGISPKEERKNMPSPFHK